MRRPHKRLRSSTSSATDLVPFRNCFVRSVVDKLVAMAPEFQRWNARKDPAGGGDSSHHMLTDEQIERFYTQGYCVARVGVDEAIVRRAIDTVWEHCPSSFRPDIPRTWKGEFTDSCQTDVIKDRRGRVKFRECLRGERWLYDLTAAQSGHPCWSDRFNRRSGLA